MSTDPHSSPPTLSGAIMERMKAITGLNSDYKLAQRFGKSTSAIHNWRKRGTIPVDECIELSVEYDVSLDWLILGRDRSDALESPKQKTDQEHQFIQKDYSGVPLYDIEAAAGPGRLFDHEHVSSFLSFHDDWITREGLHTKNLVAVRVRGDSMENTLKNGDTVLINRAITNPDGVFLIRVGDELRIKRLQRLSDGSLRLSSDNPYYAPEIIAPEALQNVHIIGHCHWHSGRVS
ncbi:LexA family transcriptional regulator [Larsenimonas salina]|uniref:LexA family transcriptional regulator n=1 Tax=Larsenimonas salina TaxID=1295565 RepID=UPI0020747B57|nr:LexA family transcriptional regulator [Larsenimonas salina]MCM5705224.1 helix-turn-helix domain-containing protein [Larsenimonas salina]